MQILKHWRRRRAAQRLFREGEALLREAVRRDAAGRAEGTAPAAEALGRLETAGRAGYPDRAHMDLRLAETLLLLGRPQDALAPAHRAAAARPYDVDSRIVHGRVRLALGDLREAEHEYTSVLEEFAGDPDARRGQLAVALARGSRTVDGQESEEELEAAADLLVGAWEAGGGVGERLVALRRSGATEAAAVEAARARRESLRSGAIKSAERP